MFVNRVVAAGRACVYPATRRKTSRCGRPSLSHRGYRPVCGAWALHRGHAHRVLPNASQSVLGFLLLPLLPLVLSAGVTGYEYFDGTVRVPGSPVGARGSREMYNLDRNLRVLTGERIGQIPS
jgi:hypothetical protein